MQRAPSSCSPPLGVAANCATRKGRRSSVQSTAKSIAQLTAQIQARCSAQRGAKTDYGFRAPNRHSPRLASVLRPVSASLRLRLRSAAFSRAWGNPVKTHKRILTISLLRRGARLSYRRGLPLRRAGAPFGCFTGRLYPRSLSARLARFIYIRLAPKSLNRSFRRGARFGLRVLPLRRAGGAFRHSEWAASAQLFVQFFVRALAEILFKRESRV